MTTPHTSLLKDQAQNSNEQQAVSLSKISDGKHSFLTIGTGYSIDIDVEHVPHSQLVLFNKDLAQQLNLDLPESDEETEQLILDNFAWFKFDDQDTNRSKNPITKTYFATRYQDSDDKSEGSALGDGRAVWVGELIKQLTPDHLQYLDVALKGTGITPLAWLNHPKKNHRDGQLGLTEAVHEYIYSSAAKTHGISTAGVLAVIKLPFIREVSNENAAIIIRVGNHLRFAHYQYFSDNPEQLKSIFEYGLRRDLGLSLTHTVKAIDVRNYLDLIVSNLASDAAIYFDTHSVHGSPTFGNITSCGGTLDFATFVFTDAHHSNYSYMSGGENLLGGEWGQTEQFFNLFSSLVIALKNSQFDYQTEIMPVEYFLRQFNNKVEQILTHRWLSRIGLSQQEINRLCLDNKERFYENVKSIYELTGSKRFKVNQGKVFMAAFEPRKILSGTAECIENFNDVKITWKKLFKVNRNWGSYNLNQAKPHINAYQKSVISIVNELKASKELIEIWQQQSKEIRLSERNEPGTDFFYDSERFFASKEVLHQINSGNIPWRKISETADTSMSELVDHGLTHPIDLRKL
ncbi:MAG: hypothetical protein GQ475_03980 [Methylococcaceae bacterium]|nr:hypothetical protein [Methylococcaceae bacterium]